jgi:hypothetical protein
VKAKDKTWNTHQWLAKPRHLAIEPSNTVIQHHCVRCGRDLLTDLSSNSSHAVFVSAISFDQLSDEVTKRWLDEPCPGRRVSLDDEDRTKIGTALRVFENGQDSSREKFWEDRFSIPPFSNSDRADSTMPVGSARSAHHGATRGQCDRIRIVGHDGGWLGSFLADCYL